MLSHADVLLLNRSNLPSRPIYPYAFVQLKALARRYRLKVASFDLWSAQADQINFSAEDSFVITPGSGGSPPPGDGGGGGFGGGGGGGGLNEF